MGNPSNQLETDIQVQCTSSISFTSKRTFSGIICITFCMVWLAALSDLAAQPFDLPPQQSDPAASLRLPAYFELGQNTVTDGLFLKTAFMPTYEFGKFSVHAGFRIDIISNNKDVLSGFNLSGSRNFMIGSFPLDVHGLYIRARYSDVLHETNWGLLLKTRSKHFKISLGTSFRTLALNKQESDNLTDPVNTKIHENWNMMYLAGYFIKPLGNEWNINFSITNIDYFNINQETNPVFKIGALYDVSPPVTLFIDSGFEYSGVLNAHIDYFGFFVKTGIIWNIWKKDN